MLRNLRWIMMSLVPLSTLAIANAAVADTESWGTQFGATTFTAPIADACDPGVETISYNTVFWETPYAGDLWIGDVSGCRTSEVEISGYFEERSENRTEWCSGQLTLTLNQRTGIGLAQWQNITAVRGYECTGAGTEVELNLVRFDRSS